MPVQPSNRTLVIPGKYTGVSRYLQDMQTLEIWARQPIQQLVAGSGITLTPASGLATDAKGNGPKPITIAASGGGTSEPGILQVIGLPDISTAGTNRLLYFAHSAFGTPGLQSYQLWSNPSITSVYTFGASWMTRVAAGQSVNIFPEFIAPAFTGGPLTVEVVMTASNAANSNALYAVAGSVSLTTGLDYQTQKTDYSAASINGADLTFVAGSGQTGNGVITAAGGVYFASVWGDITVPAATTITPGP